MRAAYDAWSEHPELSPDAGITATLTHEGDLGAIEALGFETHSTGADRAFGVVYFKDIPRLTASPQVLNLATGPRRRVYLDTSVKDMKARASAPVTGAPVDGLWHADASTGALTKVPKGTGKGVIVAIIDTGIDFKHPMFMSQLTPTKKTRILKIWDQGLVPTGALKSPDVALLESPKTYGVEFDSAKIDAHLNGGAKIAHVDCIGHGTHVAGIAAGGNMVLPTFGNAKRMGVAPEADIIAVKFVDVPDPIFYRKPDGSQDTVTVDESQRLHDAILYCLRTAKGMLPNAKPIVINISLGTDSLPGDGLDVDAVWVDEVFDPAHAPTNKNFPKGAILVKAAGNEGDASNRRVARLKVGHLGEVRLPLLLTDNRVHTNGQDWQQCRQQTYAPDISAYIWYRTQPAGVVKVAMRSPKGNNLADVKQGNDLSAGVKPATGGAANDGDVPFAPNKFGMKLDHAAPKTATHPSGGTISRTLITFSITPKVSAGSVTYYTGRYQLRITAPQDLELFVLTDLLSWNNETMILSVDTNEVGGSPIDPAEIRVTEHFSMPDPLGKNVITVAAYNDNDGKPGPDFQSIADFSSRGPLRNYSDPAAPKSVFDKPDIAAPGQNIDSAQSFDADSAAKKLLLPWWKDGVRFENMDGTSMATPAVAGATALLLEKFPDLNVNDVRSRFSSTARAAVRPSVPPDSKDAYGAGMVDAMAAHIKP